MVWTDITRPLYERKSDGYASDRVPRMHNGVRDCNIHRYPHNRPNWQWFRRPPAVELLAMDTSPCKIAERP